MVLVCIQHTETSELDLPPHNLHKRSIGISSVDRYKDGTASSKFHQIHNHHYKSSQSAWHWCLLYRQTLHLLDLPPHNLHKRNVGISSQDRYKDGTPSSKFHQIHNHHYKSNQPVWYWCLLYRQTLHLLDLPPHNLHKRSIASVASTDTKTVQQAQNSTKYIITIIKSVNLRGIGVCSTPSNFGTGHGACATFGNAASASLRVLVTVSTRTMRFVY